MISISEVTEQCKVQKLSKSKSGERERGGERERLKVINQKSSSLDAVLTIDIEKAATAIIVQYSLQ
jgi:hypothetical protein